MTVQNSRGEELDQCDLSVEASFGGGRTWESVAVEDGEVTVTADATGSVSVRTGATDDAGNSVSQTIIDAYNVA